MRNVLIFLVYAITIFAIVAGATCLVWLPIYFIPTKGGFVIGAFITTVTIAILKLMLDN